MNKIIISLTIFLLTSFVKANALTLISPSPLAKKALDSLQQLPEFSRLVQEVEQEGTIQLEMLSLGSTFDAFWDSTNRKIRINEEKNQEMGVLVSSILFELHNAKSDKRFKSLYSMAKRGEISKDQYVENVERMEHQNALNCSYLLERGITLGIFPTKARWPILRDFDDHYKLQQIKEHSLWLAKNYESMAPKRVASSPYVGTLPKLQAEDKKDLIRYLKIKNDLESVSESVALDGLICLHKEYAHLNTLSSRQEEKALLLKLIFQKNHVFNVLIQNSSLFATTIHHRD